MASLADRSQDRDRTGIINNATRADFDDTRIGSITSFLQSSIRCRNSNFIATVTKDVRGSKTDPCWFFARSFRIVVNQLHAHYLSFTGMEVTGSTSFLAPGLLLCYISACLLGLVGRSLAQTRTDPIEARVINSMFQQWGVSAASGTWNVSGEMCSGTATDASITIDDRSVNPSIKCDCSFSNDTKCRITQLKVYALDATGVIPEDIGSLTFLSNLNLGQNYLTGPIPASIGNLTRMQYLSFGINALSGVVPKELGNLQNLISLSFGSNNFSGPLPDELGRLTNLQQLYIDSSGVSGSLPSTFVSLGRLQIVWASDNQFTGKIPDFLANWSDLTNLRLQGNSFDGPIPSNIAKLTSLRELRISDISHGPGSTLGFISDMKSLGVLILRNNRISGSIPSNIGEFPLLQHLDLSFNNISGRIPGSLFTLRALMSLFLGSNNLSGALPPEKSDQLITIDLSYNELSGGFPSWVFEQNLEMNLVANNFVINDSVMRNLPSGLNCLQQNFPCNHESPRYSSFAVKCGGSRTMISSRGITYETDNKPLGPASYYVTDSQRWGVSNTGRFMENQNVSYIKNSLSQFTNTLDSELFQTMRISAGSLRYYGLGLENGNYTVSLQFTEFVIENTNSWRSLGRRIFDIYVQGKLVLRDFDIKKEAGGSSFRALVKTFVANVGNNYLDVHLFWAGKGTCCIPEQGTYGPSISAISVSPNFHSTVSNRLPGKKRRTGLVVGLVIGVLIVCICFMFMVFIFRRRAGNNEDEEIIRLNTKARTFSYGELRAATEDFSSANKLGEGSFGSVYKGTFPDGSTVAVKRLSVLSHRGRSQFMTEIATISAVQHRNLVKLLGCCTERENRLLVYEYLENKSLDQALFGKIGLHLNWASRYEICVGTAKGLAYLHEESRMRIVHRDIKASNILLDASLTPKISDFGLARLYDDGKTHMSTGVAGTIGYLSPEYAMRGLLTEKVDVFAFGVVALEVLSGRSNADPRLAKEKIYLLEWAWDLHENNRDLELVDLSLQAYDEDQALRIVGVALLCTQASPSLRPQMSGVVGMLTGDAEVGRVLQRPGYLAGWQANELTSSFMNNDVMSASSIGDLSSPICQLVSKASLQEGR